jgi:hypothetical protein
MGTDLELSAGPAQSHVRGDTDVDDVVGARGHAEAVLPVLVRLLSLVGKGGARERGAGGEWRLGSDDIIHRRMRMITAAATHSPG